MSVPVWKRNESELNLFVEALEFAVHILKITSNENIFKKEFKVQITDRINQLATDIYLNLWKANNLRLDSSFREERKKLQLLAIENCVDFLAIWNLGIRAFHLKHRKVQYVVDKLVSIRETTKKWMKNDIERLKSLNIESGVI